MRRTRLSRVVRSLRPNSISSVDMLPGKEASVEVRLMSDVPPTRVFTKRCIPQYIVVVDELFSCTH